MQIKKKINSLWTQKFGCKEITTEDYLFTAIDYIKHNRNKHHLPQHSNKGFKPLLDSIICSYEHAFRQEYKGGFDVVIGNPPYVRRTQLNENIKEFIEKVYYSAYKQYDLYVLFNELSIKILKNKGYIGFIQPNKFLSADYGFKIKNLLKNNTIIESIFNVSLDNVFSEASVYPYIFIFRKKVNIKDFIEENINLLEHCNPENLKGFGEFTNSNSLINKLKEKSITLGNLTKSIKRGIPNSKIEFSKGGDFYGIKSTLLEYSFYLPKPDIKFNYLSNEDKIKKSVEFSQNLFLLPRTTLKIRAVYKNNEYHILDRIYFFENINIKFLNEFILCMLNSNLTTFYYNNIYGSTKIGGGYIDLKGTQIENFIIPNIQIQDQQPFIEKADLMLSLNKELQELLQKFHRTLDREFFDKGFKPLANVELKPLASEEPKYLDINPLSKKLQDWYLLSYGEFIKELEKKKVKLSLSQKAAWETYFLQEAKKAQDLKSTIDTTDQQIDQMVYELYGLTEEEISIIENS